MANVKKKKNTRRGNNEGSVFQRADGRWCAVVNIGYDRDTGSFWRVRYENVPVGYPGTGDLFASVVVGALLKGDSLPIAMERATRFLELTIKTTFSYSSDPRFGVMLENTLPWLSEKQILDGYEIL